MKTRNSLHICSLFFFLVLSNQGFSLERTAVLPKGIRSVIVKQMNTTIREKYNGNGKKDPLSKALNKSLSIKDVVKKESGKNLALLKSFLALNNFNNSDVLGEFKADMAAKVRVTVPVLSYGLTDNVTLALAFPIFEAFSSVSVDFETSAHADRLVAALAGDHNTNKVGKGIETANKLNNATASLNAKLEENGYKPLGNWTGRGFGDIVAVLKHRFYNHRYLKAATTLGMTIPTGRVSDPDILNDIAFGSGAVSLFGSIISDQFVTPWLYFNQYVKGTVNFPSITSVRLKTEDEGLAVPKRDVDFLSGNKFEAGLSVQVNTSYGLLAGFGNVYERKLEDHYSIPGNPVSKAFLEKGTDSYTNHIVAKLGYSSINAFKQKKVPLPMTATFEYKKQLFSKNAPVKDFFNFEISLFF